MTILFAWTTSLSAQITREQADDIVLERLSREAQSYILYAKDGIQEEMTIATSAGEALELDYPCWVYYASRTGANDNTSCYFIVNESNGNLLEINTMSNAEPEDLEEWNIVTCKYAHLWDYPVKPEMEEWEKFESNKEKVDACQIPDNILFCLSTEKLAELCLQYPLLIDIFAFNFIDNGVDKLFSDFNGIRELYKRDDILKELLKRYQAKIQDMSLLGEMDSEEKVRFVASVSILEVLFCRYSQLTDDTKENYREILEHLVVGYEKKSMYASNFKLAFTTNFYARFHVIIKISPQSIEEIPNGDKNPVFGGSIVGCDNETADIINELSYQLLDLGYSGAQISILELLLNYSDYHNDTSKRLSMAI